MKSDLSRQRTWRYIVRPAEGRKEVVQRQFVGYVDGGERKAPFGGISSLETRRTSRPNRYAHLR